MILDSLRYWVAEMHVDGFRFDLAAVLSRDEDGRPDGRPADHLGHRDGPGPRRAPSSSPRRGTPAACTRSAASSATAGSSGTGGSATTSARSSRATRAWSRAVAPAVPRQPGHLRPPRPRAADRPSTSSPATTASRSTTWSRYDGKHNEANGEDNRDGSDAQPELELRRRGPDRRPGDRGAARPPDQELPRHRAAVGRRADAARWATRSGGRSAATTTPTATTTRLTWFDWTGLERHADILRFTGGADRDPRAGCRTLLDGPDDISLARPARRVAASSWSGVARRPARPGRRRRAASR